MPSPDDARTVTLSLPEAFALACKAAAPLAFRATHRPTGATREYATDAPYAFLGRAQVVGVRLDDPTVSQCHAYVQVVEGVPYCIDLGSRTGVVWGDGSADGRGWVEPGHTLRLGAFDVQIDAGGPPGPATGHSDHDGPGAPALSRAAVEVHSPAHPPGPPQPLDRPVTLVGRHPGCDLRVLDESVAYFQCALVNTPDGVWFVDIPNRRGAAVNGRLHRLIRLREGDLIEMGRVSLLVRLRSPSVGQMVVGGGNAGALAAIVGDPVAAVSAKVAEGVVGAMAPFRDMMGQFQQCFVTMAQMFAAMQQEHSAVVSEQMRQMQELARELKEFRAEARQDAAARATPPAPPPAPPPPAPAPAPEPARPANKMTANGTEAQTLTDAHAWFLGRLANKGQPPAGS